MNIILLFLVLPLAFVLLWGIFNIFFYREYRLPPQEVDLKKSLVNFADENVIPFWGEPEDWGFDRKLQMWMYYGEDKELKERYWEELDAFMDPATGETPDD